MAKLRRFRSSGVRVAAFLVVGSIVYAGCRSDCTPMADMGVTDPDGVAGETLLATLRDGIAEFADLTGRDTVCVPEVRVQPGDWGEETGYEGLYTAPNVAIDISATASDPETALRHELCHALDRLERHHDAVPGLYGEVEPNPAYPTADARETEAFAQACEVDPWASRVRAEVHEACGLALIDPATRYLLDHVYTGAGGTLDRVPVSIERRVVHGLPPGTNLALGSDGTTVQLLRAREVADTYTDAPVVYTLDPTTAGPIRAVRLPTKRRDARVYWSMVSGEGAVFVNAGRDGGATWRIEGGEAVADPLFPRLGRSGEAYGIVAGGAAWVTDADAWPGLPTLVRYDLSTGASVGVDWPDDAELHVFGWAASADRLVGANWDGRLLFRDLDAGADADAWTTVRGHTGTVWDIALDGDWLLATTSLVEPDDTRLSSLVLYNVADETWAIPEAPCGAAAVSNPVPLNAGGLLIWDRESISDTSDTRYLGRVTIGD